MGDNRAHSELGASISKRWMTCPGSVNLSRGREQPDNIHAQMGRAAHAVAEVCLREHRDPREFEGETVEGIPVDEEMIYAVDVFVELCRTLMADSDAYGIEEQFDLTSLFGAEPLPDMFGTTDFWSYKAAARTLRVVDYKHGAGVMVEVVDNSQLRYYALGAALKLGAKYPIEWVEITIVQPRKQHSDGVVRSERFRYFDLLDFAGELLEAARKTLPPDAPLIAGDHCRFCPAQAICPALRERVQLIAQTEFAAMPVDLPPEPSSLPADTFDDMMSKLHMLDDWSSAMKTEQRRRLERGEPSAHFKLVARRANRKWKNAQDVELWLLNQELDMDEIYKEPQLKSPAQIEKLVGKKKLPADLWVKESSGYTIAPITDPRPALPAISGPSEVFAALPPGDE